MLAERDVDDGQSTRLAGLDGADPARGMLLKNP